MIFADEAAWWPYLVILLAGWLATDIWRYLGVVAAARVDEESPVFLWVKAIATALVAGVIAQLVLFPSGALADIALPVRLAALGCGYLAFSLSGNGVLVGIVVAELVLIAGALIL